jgi:hypothetical protein
MMVKVMKAVTEPEAIAARPSRALRRVALGTGALFFAAVAVGVVIASIDHGHGVTGRHGAIVGVLLAMTAGCLWFLLRDMRAPTGEEPLTRQERMNRNLLIASGLLGGVTGAVLMIASRETDPGAILSNAPLPPALALAIVLILGVALPVIGYFWHKTVDEQEADAYKTGALYGFYVYGIGAPLWWFAARGGLLPPPDGVIIYYATLLVVGVVWMWKKYG